MKLTAHLRLPIATYRLQFNQAFTFQDAARLVPYLHALGMTDCYASPYLKAVPGSSHGYDVTDPTVLNPEVGTTEAYQEFVHALNAHGMGQILDVVPNHMGIADSCNLWWQDVLENGPSSHYATFFDIDWMPVKPELRNKVLLPILGDQYGIVLENQEITLCYDDGLFFIRYYQHRLPIDPGTWPLILSFRIDELAEQAGPSHPHVEELKSILTALTHLPLRSERDPERIAERSREKEVIKRRLATLTKDSATIATFANDTLTLFNGTKGSPRSFDQLDALLRDQAYRLAYWRVAAEEINYRRFFDINELAAIRMEEPSVFQEVHTFVFQLLHSGAVTGLRIDHVDGLFDPRSYLQQWQTWAQDALGLSQDTRGRSLFLVVEKILGKGEVLSEDWPIHGTSGYEFLFLLNNLFIDSSSKRAFDETYARFIKDRIQFDDLVYESKKLIMGSSMSSEINALGHQLNLLSERHRRSRDFTLNSLIHVIREIIACFPVYRTYVARDPSEGVTDRDRAYIRLAVIRAKRKNPALSGLIFDFVRDLLLKLPDEETRLDWETVGPFVMKFQQTTSPVTAKGLEDTAFYTYNRLVSLNEVGGEPDQFGIPVATFHERMRERQQHWPQSFSATSTHDTKRSEDVRARLNVLSELPKEWRACLSRWQRLNKKKKVVIDGQPIPDLNEEYLLYQTLIGAWPFESSDDQPCKEFCDRIQVYMNKVLKEAKIHTSWINPDEAYEKAVHQFIATILDRTGPNPFLEDFLPFQAKIAQYGMYNSLTQVLVKITAPGIPDFYQGTELWDLSLVDPDNRRPVNYAERAEALEHVQSLAAEHDRKNVVKTLMDTWTDGRIKLYITTTALNYRRTHASLFLEGDYLPLEVSGEKRNYICAFARTQGDQAVVLIVPRLLTGVIPSPDVAPFGEAAWGNTWAATPPGTAGTRYLNTFTGEVISSTIVDGIDALPISGVFHQLPIALLERLT